MTTQAQDYIRATLAGYGLTDEQIKQVMQLMHEDRAVAAEAISKYNALLDKQDTLIDTLGLAMEITDAAVSQTEACVREYSEAVASFSKTVREIASAA